MLGKVFYMCAREKGIGSIRNKCTITPKSIFPGCSTPNSMETRPRHYSFKHKHISKTHNLTEAEFLVKIKHDPDVFGDGDETDALVDEGDIQEQKFLQEKPGASQRLSTKEYADIIKSLLNNRKIKEAIDIVEVRMIKEDRVKPESYIYNLLIGACGRVGYTKKGFQLYNDMKRRALKITPGTYTALFNACSNSPWPATDGLNRAKHLRTIMIEKMYEPNVTNYNSMIKAFGRGGDLVTAFALVDEMVAKSYVIKADTLNFLFQACITDKDTGFRHALLVWRKFIQKGVSPSLFSYNLMLRCIRDCSLGDLETTQDVIGTILPPSEKVLMLEDLKTQKLLKDGETVKSSLAINIPNLMTRVPHLGSILSLSEVTKAEDRLLLVGGCKQFLQNMADNNCTPDIKTFTQLLNSIPRTVSAEQELMQAMKKGRIKPDIDFYNMLIKKRSMRFDFESAREVLGMMKSRGMLPDLITYGVLALSCKTKEEAETLLEMMSKHKYRINIEILGGMLHQACHHVNFSYVLHILEICIRQEIKPSQKFMDKLKSFKERCKIFSNEKDNKLGSSLKFQKAYRIFKMRYKTWSEEVQVDDSENVHPWQQFREKSDANVRYYKDKQEKVRFKPVHTSLFRQKTTTQNVKNI